MSRARSGGASALGDFLVFCAGADSRIVNPQDRPRFVTAGCLMLLTAGLATYAGATVAALGLGCSPLGALPYGLFYAAVIFFIDRSVLLSLRPYRHGANGTVKIGRSGLSSAVRIFIAVCAALIVGETLLLRFFAPSIEPRVAQIRQEELGRVLASWDGNQREDAQVLAADLAAKQHALDSAHDLVTAKTAEVNCQLTGGSGCLGGEGPVYRIKLDELGAATSAVSAATRSRDQAQARADAFDASRDNRRAAFRDRQTAQVDRADDLLIREKAFWRLTTSDRSVLLWRTVLTLLLLGIDLAPLIFKRTLEQTAHRRRERLAQWRGETADEVDAQQIGRTARRRAQLAAADAADADERYEQYLRRRDDLGHAVRLVADQADATVGREEIVIDRDSRIRDLRRRYRVPAPAVSDAAVSDAAEQGRRPGNVTVQPGERDPAE